MKCRFQISYCKNASMPESNRNTYHEAPQQIHRHSPRSLSSVDISTRRAFCKHVAAPPDIRVAVCVCVCVFRPPRKYLTSAHTRALLPSPHSSLCATTAIAQSTTHPPDRLIRPAPALTAQSLCHLYIENSLSCATRFGLHRHVAPLTC